MTDLYDQDVQALYEVESRVYKRDISNEKRKRLAEEDKALPDLSYPIETTEDLDNAATLARSGHGNVAAAKSLIGRRSKELGVSNPLSKSEPLEHCTRLWKAEGDEQQLVYGIGLEPDLRDSQGDTVSPAEIEKAAHDYMEHSQLADVQHTEVPARAVLVENFLAPQDMEIGGEPVTKSSWVQAWRIKDPDLWADIKSGLITGLSIGGSAERVAA